MGVEGATTENTGWRAMMRLSEVAARFGVALQGADATFTGVSTDSRSIAPGELFVALRGENFDGHKFVSSVRARGAVGALVSERVDCDLAQIVVTDSMLGYGLLAQYWRSRFAIPMLALTGSNGKTTVKEMLRSILIAYLGGTDALLATEGNLNNNIGLPQMLLRLRSYHRFAILEMGMNHLREIDYLVRLAEPSVGLIVMAGTAHIGELGSREAIAEAKGEIIAGLPAHSTAVINMHDRFGTYWRALAGARRVVGFGVDASDEVFGQFSAERLTIRHQGESISVRLKVAGAHNQRNALAAAAGAIALGVPLATIAVGLESFHGVEGRLRAYAGLHGSRVIDDTYNANPDSMRAAIAVLAAQAGTRMLVLGDMAELGADAPRLHAEIGADACKAGIDELLVIGKLATEYVAAFGEKNTRHGKHATHYPSVEALVNALTPRLDADTTVLVKGSRSSAMERVVEKIAANYSASKGNH